MGMHSLLEVQESPTIWTIVFQEEEGFIPVRHIVTSSLDNNLKLGSTANFCHACVKGGVKYGDTCWGLIPKQSSPVFAVATAGVGKDMVFTTVGTKRTTMGVEAKVADLQAQKKNNQQKGNLDSVGLRIKIHAL